jgi:mRNA deadenylase 3'-5' endonuclease subunit Ccr4
VEIISWNVNSVRARLPRVAALLARRQPDVVCLQEIKVSPQDFPVAEFTALGYACAVHGQQGRNGVAILARAAPAGVARGFDADPAPGQARVAGRRHAEGRPNGFTHLRAASHSVDQLAAGDAVPVAEFLKLLELNLIGQNLQRLVSRPLVAQVAQSVNQPLPAIPHGHHSSPSST